MSDHDWRDRLHLDLDVPPLHIDPSLDPRAVPPDPHVPPLHDPTGGGSSGPAPNLTLDRVHEMSQIQQDDERRRQRERLQHVDEHHEHEEAPEGIPVYHGRDWNGTVVPEGLEDLVDEATHPHEEGDGGSHE